jgi:phospholipid transport system substrate-binding protein
MMITRRAVLIGTVAAAGPAWAEAGAVKPIEGFAQALLAGMRAGKAVPFAQRVANLRPVVNEAFDLEAILKASVGVRWAAMAEDMKANMLTSFTDFTVATWVANFDTYDGERFEVLPETRAVGTDEVVQTRIVPKQGDVTRLDYVMRRSGAAWKAVDILMDGSISRVAVQRSDFRGVLAKGEAALLQMFRDKAADLAKGAK